MLGNIYTDQPCPQCEGVMVNDEKRHGCFCKVHDKIRADRGFRVRLSYKGKLTTKRFDNYEAAYQFLLGLRFKIVEGSFDARDYQADNPLAFGVQSQKWLAVKAKEVSGSHHRNLRRYIRYGTDSWGDGCNVKAIGYAELEDMIHGLQVADKTKHDTLAAYHQFFHWLEKRERIPMPDIPDIDFTLGFRELVDLETQDAIIAKVKEIAPYRVWLGIKWMATYVACRPGEFWALRERDINMDGYFVFPPGIVKGKDPVIIPMLEEDIELYNELPTGMPDLPFFRWEPDHSRTPGKQYGRNLFYQWWKRACALLGIEGVDLYGGVRHSTVTAAGNVMPAEDVKDHLTQHRTNKAFDRYFQHKTVPSTKALNAMADARKKTRKKGEVIDLKKAQNK